MLTPLKATASLLFNIKAISPLSPRCNQLQSQTIRQKPKQILLFEEPDKVGMKINITKPNETPKKTLIYNKSPKKSNLLNFDFYKCDNLNILGKGSFATVVKAIYRGELVAAKFCKPGEATNEENGLHLNHTNIIKTLKIISGSEYDIVMMKCYPNLQNLQTLLDKSDAVLKRHNILSCARDIISGLNYCHENKILHLDIKPKNILLADFDSSTLKICDFGNSFNITNRDSNWKFKGTTIYASPEMLKGNIPSAKSDIYSFGIVLWQLIFRKYPYPPIDNHVLIYKVVKFNFRPQVQNFLIGTEDLLKLCERCWDENQNIRPEAKNVSKILKNLLN